MLSLSRKKGQRLRITVAGRVIVMSLNDIRGDKVRIGVTADEDVKVTREELLSAEEIAELDRFETAKRE